MYRSLILASIFLTTTIQTASAQVDLSTYADANGFINVQTLTCAQLDDRFHETGLDEASIHGTGIMFVDSSFEKS